MPPYPIHRLTSKRTLSRPELRNRKLPHPPPIVQAARPTEGSEGGEDDGQAGFSLAGEAGGDLGLALRIGCVGQQFGDGGELLGECRGPGRGECRGGTRFGGGSGSDGIRGAGRQQSGLRAGVLEFGA
mgnify:CR=1 FL=1